MNLSFFFFNDTATTEIYTLSLHDALPISVEQFLDWFPGVARAQVDAVLEHAARSEEHTSELQSHSDLVCRLLLEKKNTRTPSKPSSISRTALRAAGRASSRNQVLGERHHP